MAGPHGVPRCGLFWQYCVGGCGGGGRGKGERRSRLVGRRALRLPPRAAATGCSAVQQRSAARPRAPARRSPTALARSAQSARPSRAAASTARQSLRQATSCSLLPALSATFSSARPAIATRSASERWLRRSADRLPSTTVRTAWRHRSPQRLVKGRNSHASGVHQECMTPPLHSKIRALVENTEADRAIAAQTRTQRGLLSRKEQGGEARRLERHAAAAGVARLRLQLCVRVGGARLDQHRRGGEVRQQRAVEVLCAAVLDAGKAERAEEERPEGAVGGIPRPRPLSVRN